MKKLWLAVVILAVLAITLFIFRFLLFGNEDSWIKNEKGRWIEHGNPAFIPAQVLEQQIALECALNLYNENKNSGMNFSSQCLGTCGNYAVDIVHIPRNNEDNLAENQCSEFREGRTSRFIELDKNGMIVRIEE